MPLGSILRFNGRLIRDLEDVNLEPVTLGGLLSPYVFVACWEHKRRDAYRLAILGACMYVPYVQAGLGGLVRNPNVFRNLRE